jgi:Flp pilus assembly pilin Flp
VIGALRPAACSAFETPEKEPLMRRLLNRFWRDQDGVLSFEWTLVVVLVVIGIIAGLGAARDVVIDELGDLAGAVLAFDQSYSFAGIPLLEIPASHYEDELGEVVDCGRSSAIP